MKRPLQNDRPAMYRHETIVLSEDRVKLRAVLLVLLGIIAAASFAYGVNALFTAEPGIREITALTGEMNSGDDFTFYYSLGSGEVSATDEERAVRSLYTQAATDAFRVFSADMEFEDCGNLWYLNQHINEPVAVEPALYNALALLENSGGRYHYLAPVYELYFSLFQSESDQEAFHFDPYRNEDLRRFYQEAADFANDPGAVDVELLGDDTVCLRVSEEYLAFAEKNGVTRFVELFWMENAFAADYMAAALMEGGYTRGVLISEDGFIRSLGDAQGVEYALTFTHREENVVSNLASLRFSGMISMVYLRDYPVDNGGSSNYYVYKDGTIRCPYVDPRDGLDRSAIPELAVYSESLSCAELTVLAAPLYIAESFDSELLESLTEAGVLAYYQADGKLCVTGG